MAKIVHARINENGQITGGKKGDQTGKEVVKQDFYKAAWTYVFRPRKKALAEKIVKNAEAIAANDYYGYGQDGRYGMWEEAQKVDWDFSKVTTPCHTDCSQTVSCVLNASGVPITQYLFTWNMKANFAKLVDFETITYTEGMTLKAGDILLMEGHTVIVVEGDSGNEPLWVGECYGMALVPVFTKPSVKASRCSWPTLATGNLFDVCGEENGFYYIRIAGTYYGYIEKQFVLRKTPEKKGTVTSAVYVRVNAGSGYKKIGVLGSGQIVEICDTKKAANGADWYYVKYGTGWGFSSAKYIKVK